MSFSRRQLVQVAATGSVAALAGCSGLIGGSPNTSGDIEAEASVSPSFSRQTKAPLVTVVWTVNKVSDHLTVEVRNVSAGASARTALCGVGATVRFNGRKASVGTNGPVGSPPDCESGTPSGLEFARGDTVRVVVTAHAGDDATKEIISQEFTFPTPTPEPNGGN